MGKKILLADDSITIQKVIELTFSDEDFEVVTVGNGRLAIERAPEVRPDIVLCDIIMPEKDGYEVCEFIKKHPTLSGVPVLLLTGAFEPFDQERAARVGCDGFLAKPFEPAMLIGKVKDLLSQAAARPAAPPPPAVATAAMVPPAPPVPEPVRATEPFYSPAPSASQHFERFAVPEGTLPGPAASFITDEPVLEEMPEQAPFEMGAADATTGAGATSVLEEELYGMGEAEAAPEDFPPVGPEEANTLAGAPRFPDSTEEDVSSTVIFRPDTPAPWMEAAPEVPAAEVPMPESLEPEAMGEPAGFEEVFDEEIPPSPLAFVAPEPAFEPEPEPEPEPVAVPVATVPRAEVAPVPEPMAALPPAVVEVVTAAPPTAAAEVDLPEEVSFADLAPAAPAIPPTAPSGAAEVAVPVDLVAQIAQRVVAQISEKVVREVAWEVIPELAEALIKREIERLKAELQKT